MVVSIWVFVGTICGLLVLLSIACAVAVYFCLAAIKARGSMAYLFDKWSEAERRYEKCHEELHSCIQTYLQGFHCPDDDLDEEDDDADDWEVRKQDRLLKNPDAWKEM